MGTDTLELTPPSRSKGELYIPSLDGLRAVAVLIVFFSHVGGKGLVPGGFGVTIFFFLSGYLITTLLRLEFEAAGRISLRTFYLRRVLRIFPPMYVALVIASVFALALGVKLSGTTLLLQSTHLTNYYVAFGGVGHPPGTEVLWSLSVEEHFYLLFPLAFIALTRTVTEKYRPVVLVAACGAVLIWRIIAIVTLRLPSDYTTHASDTRIDSILFGCILALWRNPALPGPKFQARTIWGAATLGLLILGATLVPRSEVFRESVRYTIQGIALTPVFIAVITYPQVWPVRLLNFRAVRWLGILSYSFYLLHLPIINFVERTTTLHGVLLISATFAISLLAAALIYFAVERPCARLRKRLSRPSTRRANVAT